MSVQGEVPLVVYKLGGSLLDLPDLANVLRALVSRRTGCGVLLLVGGGAAADIVRDWDRRHHLGDDVSHALALQAMRLNEGLLLRLMPELKVVTSARQALLSAAAGTIGLICAPCFLRWAETAGHPRLPRTWKLTSDSIAAFSAGILGATELILLKSVPVPGDVALAGAAQAGLVDELFPEFAKCVPHISWVDARAATPVIRTWQKINGS